MGPSASPPTLCLRVALPHCLSSQVASESDTRAEEFLANTATSTRATPTRGGELRVGRTTFSSRASPTSLSRPAAARQLAPGLQQALANASTPAHVARAARARAGKARHAPSSRLERTSCSLAGRSRTGLLRALSSIAREHLVNLHERGHGMIRNARGIATTRHRGRERGRRRRGGKAVETNAGSGDQVLCAGGEVPS